MKKLARRIIYCGMIAAVIWSGVLIRDKKTLREGLIRFHVVANSDSEQDQMLKLQVRDAVLVGIQEDLARATNLEMAQEYLSENITKIQSIADQILREAGSQDRSVVTLGTECFNTRSYETFSLPAGVYDSLRIVIGNGDGHNWWCVTFPSLCLPTTEAGFEAVAADAGMSERLTSTLAEKDGYKIRFYILDKLGQLENIFCME